MQEQSRNLSMMSNENHEGRAYFANCQDVVNIEALEKGPHGEIDINEATTKVQTTGESCDDFKASLTIILWAGIELDDISSSRSRVGKNFGNLESM